MKTHDYSQIVVWRATDQKRALLTIDGIARWLEQQHVKDRLIALDEASLADALQYEDPQSSLLLSRQSTIYDAQEAFVPKPTRPRLFAIIGTQSGKALGIITPWDIHIRQ